MIITGPRHRAEVVADAAPLTRCTTTSGACPPGALCPRHNPDHYAEYMARHAVDSIPRNGRRFR